MNLVLMETLDGGCPGCIYMNAGNRLHECTKIGCGTLICDGLQYTPKENISNLVIVII